MLGDPACFPLHLVYIPCLYKVWCFGKWENSVFSLHPKKNITQNETYQHSVFLFNTEINYTAATSHTFPVTFREGREKKISNHGCVTFSSSEFHLSLGCYARASFQKQKGEQNYI